jgi:hypothetical protein
MIAPFTLISLPLISSSVSSHLGDAGESFSLANADVVLEEVH